MAPWNGGPTTTSVGGALIGPPPLRRSASLRSAGAPGDKRATVEWLAGAWSAEAEAASRMIAVQAVRIMVVRCMAQKIKIGQGAGIRDY